MEEGTKLPTHRDLASKLGVALGTITRVYSELESKGMIVANRRRGTIVGKPHGGKDSLAALVKGGDDTIDFSINYPPVIYEREVLHLFSEIGKNTNSKEGEYIHNSMNKITVKMAKYAKDKIFRLFFVILFLSFQYFAYPKFSNDERSPKRKERTTWRT